MLSLTVGHLTSRGCPLDTAKQILEKLETCCPDQSGNITVTFNPAAFVRLFADIAAQNWAAIPGDLLAIFG